MWEPLNLTSMVWRPFSLGMNRMAYLSGEPMGGQHQPRSAGDQDGGTHSFLSLQHRPCSSSVITHSSRAPEGLWTLADILPCAPLRYTAKDAG